MMSGMAGGEVSIVGRYALFDGDGNLAAECREIWTLVEPKAERVARAFWACYAQSGEVARPIAADKMDELTRRIIPYLRTKFGDLSGQAWVDTVRDYVASAAAGG